MLLLAAEVGSIEPVEPLATGLIQVCNVYVASKWDQTSLLQAAELAGPKRDKGVLGYGGRKYIEFIFSIVKCIQRLCRMDL